MPIAKTITMMLSEKLLNGLNHDCACKQTRLKTANTVNRRVVGAAPLFAVTDTIISYPTHQASRTIYHGDKGYLFTSEMSTTRRSMAKASHWTEVSTGNEQVFKLERAHKSTYPVSI